MAKYIDAYALKQRISLHSSIQRVIDSIPAADVRPERHGKWKRSCDEYSYFCSICGEEPDKSGRLLSDFCPWCGAKMDGKDGENDG